MAGAGGIAALTNCRNTKPLEKLIPYINPPNYPKPGDWAFYSTTCRECPAGCGMLMWHRDGRVTKAEGNPFHPVNKGRLCIRGQSSVQGLYNPDRIQNVLEKDINGGWINSGWDLAIPEIRTLLQTKKPVLISRLETGSLAGIMDDFASGYSTKPVWYEVFNYESLRTAGKAVYGLDRIPRFDLGGCDLIVSFNADFLETWLSPVEYAGDFAEIHSSDGKTPGRLMYVGYSENLTALNADEFIITRPGSHASIINNISSNISKRGGLRNNNFVNVAPDQFLPGGNEQVVERISDAILKAKSPIIIAGRGNDNSAEGVSAVKAAYLLNEKLGNGNRIDFSQYHSLSNTVYRKDLHSLFGSLSADNVVVIYNTNPAYSEPGFVEYLKKVSAVVYIGPEANETSALANYFLPSHYPLEDWGDYEGWKGTISLLQPTMRPLYNSMSPGDIFHRLGVNENFEPFENISIENRKKWSAAGSSPDVNMRRSHIRLPEAEDRPAPSFNYTPETGKSDRTDDNLFIDPVPSIMFYDGRLANRSWLQEIPDPLSDIVWENCININDETAAILDIRNDEIVTIKSSAGSIDGPVRLTGNISKNVISLTIGQGHNSFGETANGRGSNVFSLIPPEFAGCLPVITIERKGKISPPVYLNRTRDQYGRDLLRTIRYGAESQKELITIPLPGGYDINRDLYTSHPHKNHRWAMVIDLQRCIGCKSCVAACYAENNIPIMGKQNCSEGLEMAWLKVPAYRTEDEKISFLPLPCQHCDAAPCEPVCPVYASAHTDEGLNAQIYNRCVGTRYCSNNCPYKVRRFNWKNIEHKYPGTMQLNPEVTVRERGVMEKCTFCVQRIRNAEYSALKNNRTLHDGDIVPACAQTCPAEAIVFGDLMDPGSRVSKLFDHERRYQLLHQLNTKPAVVYLKKMILDI